MKMSDLRKKWLAETEQYKEYVNDSRIIIRNILLPCLFVMVLVFVSLGVSYPLLPLSILMAIYYFGGMLIVYLLEKGFISMDLFVAYMWLETNVVAAAALYYTGGIESFAFAFFLVIAILVALLRPNWHAWMSFIIAATLYFLELFAEMKGWLPHISVFKELVRPEQYSRSGYYLIIPLANVIIMAVIVVIIYHFAQMLKERWERLLALNLEKAYNETELRRRSEENSILRARMKDKIVELEELRQNLENIAEEKAVELKDRITEMGRLEANLKEKMAELKEFKGLHEGRGKRIVDLEAEINVLLQELGRPQKYEV